jgi:Ca2+-dependent lipid-binding protein
MAQKGGYGSTGGYGGVGMQGTSVQVNVVGCRHLTDKEWFTKQDPYVVIEYGSNRFRTRTDTDGGRNPSFNEKFTIPLIEGLRELTVQVWNSNTIALDDFIGSTRCPPVPVFPQFPINPPNPDVE